MMREIMALKCADSNGEEVFNVPLSPGWGTSLILYETGKMVIQFVFKDY